MNAIMKRASPSEPGSTSMADTPPPSKRKPTGPGPWSMQLLESMKNPDMIVQSDELTVTIRDAFPKAKHHYLVLPRADISNFKSLDISHLHLLKHMLKCGQELVDRLKTKQPLLRFRCGYHAVPSMIRLHMHVISQDFESRWLKTKKHWNSFTSEFFIDAEEILRILEKDGKVELDKAKYELILKRPLKCHVCHEDLQNIPKLKSHILKHC